MIVIYAPFPSPQLVRGGWMRRIATVERIFADRPRTYVYPGDPAFAADPGDYRVHFAEVADGASFAWLDFRLSNHVRKLTELVDAADFMYAHTSHSCQHLLPYYRTGKVITDLHGIAPEEEELQGKPGRAAFFGALEEEMVRESAALVTVTEAMADHFRAKYPGLRTPTILMPIVEEVPSDVPLARPARERPVVVYAGGLQSWQNVELMMDAVARCRDRCDFRFYTEAVPEMAAVAEQYRVTDVVRIETAAPEELPAIYGEADLGFVLRDDIAVNRVSCPTKLSEYLAFGVVPVVTLPSIGDFDRQGYQYVHLDDLLGGNLPGPERMSAMRARNREVFDDIRRAFREGARRLRELEAPTPRTSVRERPSLFLTSGERASFFPIRGARLEVVRASGRHEVPLDDEVGPVVDLTIDLPGQGELRALHLVLAWPPYVTTPIRARLLDESDAALELSLEGGFGVDRFGNWVFSEAGARASARDLQVYAARWAGASCRLSLRFEFILAGPEAWITSAHPWAGVASFARRVASAVRRRLRGVKT